MSEEEAIELAKKVSWETFGKVTAAPQRFKYKGKVSYRVELHSPRLNRRIDVGSYQGWLSVKEAWNV